MNRTLNAIKEWINPNWSRHKSVPPMEGGLRPNSRLDDSEVLLPVGEYEPDDVLAWESGEVWFSSGNSLWRLRDGVVGELGEFDGHVGTVVRSGADAVISVEGLGLVRMTGSGLAEELCTAEAVRSCVTDIAALSDGSLAVAVGSRHEDDVNGWQRSLARHDRSGCLVRVDGTDARVEDEGLAWPSGIEVAPDGDVIVALSTDHRVERRADSALGGRGRSIFANLPLYPGRIAAIEGGWWIASPYVRNRITELVLDEPELLADMVETISQSEWFVPRLRSENPFTDPLQMGQLRVLGVIKPWAPPRSYGLAFRIDYNGLTTSSAHSRVDGDRHGITGVSVCGTGLVLAARGYRTLLQLREE